MTKILWSEGLKTGITSVDLFHASFVELLNELEEEIVAKSPIKSIKSVIADIYDLSRTGFQQEEDLMRESAYQELELRIESHQKFLSELEFFLKERIKTPEDEAYFECYDFLYAWFFQHALEDDARFARHLEDMASMGQAA